MSDLVKVWLYKSLGLKKYLQLLQNIFLLGYKTGLLKRNEKYRWHYFVHKLIEPTDVIIDIGANLGYFSLVFSKIINSNGRLYCVEPVRPYRELLEKKLPRAPNIIVCPFALGDKNADSIRLGMPPLLQHLQYLRHGTVTILKDENISENQLVFESEVKKGSEVFADIRKLDYIKCDIEGYETVVFPEMKAILQKHKPLVQLETWGEQLPIMLTFFSGLGYTAYHLTNNKLINCKELSLTEIAASDILFVPAERRSKLIDFIA
jgi:FkbM family methyltransferase